MINPFVAAYRYLPHASRQARRLLVLATFAGYPLVLIGYGTLVAPGRLSSAIWAPIAIVLMSMTIFGSFAIYGFARDRANLGVESLDERQRQLRDRALIVSYAVLSTIVTGAAGIAAAWAVLVGPITLEFGDMAGWLVAFALFLPILPSAALAWIEPDEPADDSSAT